MLAAGSSAQIGQEMPSFGELPGTDGRFYSLRSFQEKEILVVVFMANGCPILKNYDGRLTAMQRDYDDSGVQLVAVNPNNSFLSPFDTFPEMVKRSTSKGFNFPYLKDENRVLAEKQGAVCTPHVFVFDSRRMLRYSGRIDDSWNPDKVTTTYVRNALDDLLQGREVRVKQTKPFGCGIVW